MRPSTGIRSTFQSFSLFRRFLGFRLRNRSLLEAKFVFKLPASVSALFDKLCTVNRKSHHIKSQDAFRLHLSLRKVFLRAPCEVKIAKVFFFFTFRCQSMMSQITDWRWHFFKKKIFFFCEDASKISIAIMVIVCQNRFEEKDALLSVSGSSIGNETICGTFLGSERRSDIKVSLPYHQTSRVSPQRGAWTASELDFISSEILETTPWV